MEPVQLWTGRAACTLQAALRLSNESFAHHLGIAPRTVAMWHQKPDRVPQPDVQKMLDTALSRADEGAQQRFTHALPQCATSPAVGHPDEGDSLAPGADLTSDTDSAILEGQECGDPVGVVMGSGWLQVAPSATAPPDGSDIGEILRWYRVREGLSQQAVAAQLHTTQSRLSKLEKGTQVLRDVDELRRLARQLGIPPERLGVLPDHAGDANPLASHVSEQPGPGRDSQEHWREVRRELNTHRADARRPRRRAVPQAGAHPRHDGADLCRLAPRRPGRPERHHTHLAPDSAGPPHHRQRPGISLRPTADGQRETLRPLFPSPARSGPTAPAWTIASATACSMSTGRTTRARRPSTTPRTSTYSTSASHWRTSSPKRGWARAASVRVSPTSPFRRAIDDPFDLAARPMLPSINTLTIRLDSIEGHRMYLHRRDAKSVAAAGGMYHVIPAGAFQPAALAPAHQSNDFSLWRNIQREFSEEFLGNAEHDGNSIEPIAYDADEPFVSFERARLSRRLPRLRLRGRPRTPEPVGRIPDRRRHRRTRIRRAVLQDGCHQRRRRRGQHRRRSTHHRNPVHR